MKPIALNLFFVVLIFLLASGILTAAEYWISADGPASGIGSQTEPFPSIRKALEKVGGGHTFIFKPGYYNEGQINIWPQYSGSPEHPTILKSQEKYGAILHGSTCHNIYVKENTNWVIIDGFVSSGADSTGIKSNGNYTVIRNCWILNNAQGIEAHSVKGSVIENNLIEFNGRHIQFDHGIYADGDSLIIRNNIIRFNSGFGLHLYSSISNSRIENNLVYGNNRPGIGVFGDGDIGKNIIINNTVVRNGSGIYLNKAKSDVVYNNIVVENISTWRWDNETSANIVAEDIVVDNPVDPNSLKIDYNICSVKSKYCGSHTILGNPLFLRKMKGLFYLNLNSPAIGSGSSDYFAKRDFFGNERNVKAIDMGCFAFDKALLDQGYRKEWYLEWPYHYRDKNAVSRIPDLWKPPETKASQNP
jgi:parallel beta-helix repeat protein